MLTPRIMKLHRNIDHDWQMTPIDFQVVVWHGRQQVINAPLALRQCYLSIRASYSLTLPTTPRYKAENGEPFAPVYGRSRKRHQYVLLPGYVCSAFYNVLLQGIVCSGIYRLLPGSIQLG
ncbi:hypothetical protein DPMN_113863 [Dreissena polymorpha]|uniref:Uncharacterized protein n=1 Tax=Dreissena polymorpha TaxID=45954 RepID=A0A9D4KIZ0_DREPO|nr:hypothetical protein DPMN_113863 [Dreissena polymorpha]